MEIRTVEPPYEELGRRILAEPGGAVPAPGGVLAITVRGYRSGDELRETIASLHRYHPGHPVVLYSEALPTPQAARFALGLRGVGVRCILFSGEPVGEVLRGCLTDSSRLPEEVDGWLVRWMRSRGHPLPPRTAALVRLIVQHALATSRTGQLLGRLGISASTARFRLEKANLPPAAAWHGISRILHTALRLQAEPRLAIQRLAAELGYADHSLLHRQTRRLTGMTPGDARRFLGWEWLATEWLKRIGTLEVDVTG